MKPVDTTLTSDTVEVHTRIDIRYWAQRMGRGSYRPMYSINGKSHTSAWAKDSYSYNVALAAAKRDAIKEANRFTGDYTVMICAGRSNRHDKERNAT